MLEPINLVLSFSGANINTLNEYTAGPRRRMNVGIFTIIYVICAAASFLTRLIFMKMIGARETKRGSRLDQFLIAMIVTSMVLPLIYILTTLLDFAN